MTDIEELINLKFKELTSEQYLILKTEFIKEDFKKFNYSKFILKFQRKYKFSLRKTDLIKLYYNLNLNDINLKNLIIKKNNKSNSGIISLTIVLPPSYDYINDDGETKKINFSCEFDCFYCPNQPNQPRSYIDSSPALLRSNMYNHDCIKQINSRLNTLIEMGHIIDKIEIIILGGSFQSFNNFIR